MQIALLLSAIYIFGFILTILLETTHILTLNEPPEKISSGIPILLLKKHDRRVDLYPLFPIIYFSKIRLSSFPLRLRVLAFALSGCIVGTLASIICGFFGHLLFPAKTLSEFSKNGHRLGFLLRDVCSGTTDIPTVLSTALILSVIIFFIQSFGNLMSIAKYDGYRFLCLLNPKD